MRTGCVSFSPFDLSNIYFITHPHLYTGGPEVTRRREETGAAALRQYSVLLGLSDLASPLPASDSGGRRGGGVGEGLYVKERCDPLDI